MTSNSAIASAITVNDLLRFDPAQLADWLTSQRARRDCHRPPNKRAIRAAQPTASAAATAVQQLAELRREQQREQLFARWIGSPETITVLEQRRQALDTWRQWADGATIDPDRIRQTASARFVSRDPTSN